MPTRADSSSPPDLDVLVAVKDHRVIRSSAGSGRSKTISFLDQGGPREDGKVSYCYLRAHQEDDMYARTSPVWVDWKD